MYCQLCGATVPDGQTTCPVCGAPIDAANQQQGFVQPQQGFVQPQQPVQPMQPQQDFGQPMGQPMQPQQNFGQPMGQPMQPQQDFGQPMGQPMQPQQNYSQPAGGAAANFGAITKDYMKIVGIVGAFFIFLAPFLSWAKVKVWGISESGNMFKVTNFGKIAGVVIILGGIALILWNIAEFVPAINNIKAKFSGISYLELIVVVALFVLMLIVFFTSFSGADYKDAKEGVKMLGGKLSHGIGPVVGFIGVVCAALPSVFSMLNINIGKKN